MFEAVLVALADHGFTPTAISARLTLLSAPDSIQGALAAGLLGGGSRFLGVTEDAANFLHAAIADLDELPTDEHGWDAVADERRGGGTDGGSLRARARSPGPQARRPAHAGDVPARPRPRRVRAAPRAVRSRSVVPTRRCSGKTLPLNGAGVCGAVLADIDVPLGVVRGVALLARCAGLLGHLAEEMDDPIANDIYMNVDRNTDYRPPAR